MHIVFIFSTAVVGAHPHGDHSEDHGRMLAMPDGTYVCPVCGYVYDPAIVGTAFAAQSATYKCPVCTQPKAGFEAWDAAWDSKPLCLNKTHSSVNGAFVAIDATASNDPCKNCANHANFGLQCLPANQGGEAKFYTAPAKSETEHKMVATGDGKYVCDVCGYVYDPAVSGKAFADEPESMKCPVCTQPKKGFTAWTTTDDSKLLCLNKTHHKMGTGMVMANSEMDSNPCVTCENHGKMGHVCFPSGQGGMDKFVGEAPPQAATTTAAAPAPAPASGTTAAPATAATSASGSLRIASLLSLGGVLAFAWSV